VSKSSLNNIIYFISPVAVVALEIEHIVPMVFVVILSTVCTKSIARISGSNCITSHSKEIPQI